MIIRIKNLKLHTIIGINDWEKLQAQKIIVNIELHLPNELAATTDNIDDSLDYKCLKYEIISKVEKGKFLLLEKLAAFIADIAMQHPEVAKVVVEVDKPGALRYADSVSLELCRTRE